MNCTCNLVFARMPSIPLPSLLGSLSLLVGVYLHFLSTFTTELIPLSLPDTTLATEPVCSHGNGLKTANCFCKKNFLSSSVSCCYLLKYCCQMAGRTFLSVSQGGTRDFFSICWSRSQSNRL